MGSFKRLFRVKGPKWWILTYLLTSWCRVLLDMLTGLQLVKKFPAFHGTRRFITALTSVRHLSLPWASPIQSIYPHPTSWRSILILSTHLHLGFPSGPFPSGFPTKTLYTPLSSLLMTNTRIKLPTYLPTHPPTNQTTNQPTNQQTNLPTYLSLCLYTRPVRTSQRTAWFH